MDKYFLRKWRCSQCLPGELAVKTEEDNPCKENYLIQYMCILLFLFLIFLGVNKVQGKEGKEIWEEEKFVNSCLRTLPKFIDKTEERN